MKVSNIHKFYLLYAILFSLFFYSCDDKDIPRSSLELKDNLLYKRGSNIPFTGRERALVNNQIVEYDVKDGYKHGVFRIFSEDGVLEMEGQLDSNKNVGRWRYYYANGRIESEGFFINDMPEGKWKWYHQGGAVKEEGIFRNGIRKGMWYQYNNSGNVIVEKNYDLKDTLATERDTAKTN